MSSASEGNKLYSLCLCKLLKFNFNSRQLIPVEVCLKKPLWWWQHHKICPWGLFLKGDLLRTLKKFENIQKWYNFKNNYIILYILWNKLFSKIIYSPNVKYVFPHKSKTKFDVTNPKCPPHEPGGLLYWVTPTLPQPPARYVHFLLT